MIIAPNTTIPRQDLQASFMEAPSRQLYIASRIYVPFEVSMHAGAFGRLPLAEQLKNHSLVRNNKGEYPRSEAKLDDDTWLTREYGHEASLDNRQSVIYRNFIDFETAEANRLRELMLRGRESRVAAKCHNTTTFPLSGNTGKDISNEWDDYANAAPIDDVRAGLSGMRARGVNPAGAVLQISWRAQWDLSQCDQILQRLKYTGRPSTPISLPELALALGVAEVIVGGGFYNSADQGLAASIADIWNPEYAFLFVPARSGDISEACIGRTMVWKGDGGGDADEPAVEEYISDPNRASILRVRHDIDEKELFTACGFLLGNCYTA